MPPEAGKHKIKILIVDDIPDARENLKKLLAFEPDMEVVGTAGTGREALERARETQPHIILMDINMPDMDGITATREMRKMLPTAGVIMMSVQSEAEYMRRAVQAGARDFLTKPTPAEELYTTVRNIYNDIQQFVVLTPTGGPGTEHAPGKGIQQTGRDTYVIVVYSPIGGAGKTTVATNIATELMKESSKVLLIDANMQFGDVSIFLNLRAPTTIMDLLSDVDSLDMDLVDSVLLTHDSGLRVLMPPQRPEEAELVDAAKVKLMIEKLFGAFDYIIVDTATKLDGLALELFDIAHRIVLVATPTLPSVIHSMTVISLMEELGYSEDKIQFVLNKVTPDLERAKVTLATAAIEQRFKRKAMGIIPMDERKVLFAVNRGTSVVAKDRAVSPAKDIIALADALRASLGPTEAKLDDAQPQQKSGLFGGLMKSGVKPAPKSGPQRPTK